LKDQPDVRLVSFSVDPTHDGPDTLALYASAHHADMRRWSFLTGPVPTIYSVAKDGFHLPLDSTGGDQTTPIIHSPRFVLIDTKGSVRAYYDGSQDESRKKILSDIEALREEVAR
jgi:protein SCO1/2